LLALENPAPSAAFDIVFCRNLLIYFDDATQRAAIRKLNALLADDGLLFTGYAEAATLCRQGFVMADHSKAFALKRKPVVGAKTGPVSEPRRRSVAAKATAPAVVAAPTVRRRLETVAAPASPSPEVLLDDARRLADAGKTAEAGAKYRACLKAAPDCVEAYFMLGLLSERAGERAAAADLLRRAVYLDPGHYEALCHLALLAEREGAARDADLFRQRAARVFERLNGKKVQAGR
jgi:chemotaxis protein methyltransferase WspC